MKLLLIFLALYSLSQSAIGQVYTLGPTDNLTKACAALQAGDELILKPGEYTINATNFCAVTAVGTSASPVIIRGEDVHNVPVIKRTSGSVFILKGASYVTLTDLACDGSPDSCVGVRNSNHIKILGMHAWRNLQGVDIQGSHYVRVQFGIFLWNTRDAVYVSRGSTHITVADNFSIYNARGLTGDRCTLCAGGSALNPSGSDMFWIRNGVAYNGGPYDGVQSSDAAMTPGFGPRMMVIGNYVWRNRRGGINVADMADGSVVSDNYVASNGTACAFETSISGLMIANGAPNTMVSNNTVTNNCVASGPPNSGIGAGAGLLVRAPPSRAMENIKLFNNRVSGTKNGPDYLVDPKSSTQGLWMSE